MRISNYLKNHKGWTKMDNKKRVSQKDTKKILLELLKFFDSICCQNEIEYSLSGGSLLGAVRNQGIIPWDDDVDVMLTRPNYEKAKKVFNSLHDSKIGFMDENTDGFYYPFSKLYSKQTLLQTFAGQDSRIRGLGIFLDVFPIDIMPEPGRKLDEYYDDMSRLNQAMWMDIPGFFYANTNILKRFAKRIVRYPRYHKIKSIDANPENWKKIVLKEITKFDNTTEKNAGFILSEYGSKESIPKETFNHYSEICFEGNKYMAVSDYDTYLHALYGNYLELPPKEKRVPKHNYYIAYWK